MWNETTKAQTAEATLALLDIMPRECVEFLIEWWGELFDGLTAQKVEEYISYDNMDDYDTVDELAEDWGYDNREDMEDDYTLIADVAFPGLIIIQ